MSKSAQQEAEQFKPGGPGLKYRPTSFPKNASADIPSKTIGTSPNSDKRGKDQG